ncbi:hypothetical protein [Hydrogenophaga sp. BPS33]|uniref:hypothetical protein n=1 Tax=Hydrogenophaga sp. BPS33 TaxID=2651974 RepID=UPI00131FE47B|nr:hypothetical protein [Hydrogenophaga sp. BPS33]QHE87897.1 hypothetical protein F9K07_24875 [Hydrogenophaga sp. BPS33]
MRLRKPGFVADACGARLRHLLPRLDDGQKKIRDYAKEELVTLRTLTASLERMVRPDTPDNAMLPGARLTLAGVRGVDQHAESLVQQILRRKSAEERVKTAQTILKGSDLPRLGRLKASVDFLVAEG